MKTYTITRHSGTNVTCMVEEYNTAQTLDLRLDLWNHSPTGFNFGYEGSGAAQLALAILADCFKNDDDRAVEVHQWFKREVVAKHQEQSWQITSDEILKIVSRF